MIIAVKESQSFLVVLISIFLTLLTKMNKSTHSAPRFTTKRAHNKLFAAAAMKFLFLIHMSRKCCVRKKWALRPHTLSVGVACNQLKSLMIVRARGEDKEPQDMVGH